MDSSNSLVLSNEGELSNAANFPDLEGESFGASKSSAISGSSAHDVTHNNFLGCFPISSSFNADLDHSFVKTPLNESNNASFNEPVNLLNISTLETDDSDSDGDSIGLQWQNCGSPDCLYSSDEENGINHDNLDDPLIYDGAPITVDESMTAILTYIVKHELDGREIVDLLNLIHLHCKEENNNIRTSLYLFKKYFSDLKSPIIYHYFCSSCYHELKQDNLKCPNLPLHPKTSDISYFVEIPLISQLQALFSKEEYERKKAKEENIDDIYDGQLYRELVASGFISDSNHFNFTMIMNADGVPVFKSSKKSLWPVFFNVLELPPQLRFKKEFTMIGGLWFGGKPMANIILGKLIPSFHQIKKGFEVQPFGSTKSCQAKGILLAATSDLPAKAMLMGMMSHSGAKSCHVCKINGESIKIRRKKNSKENLKRKQASQKDNDEKNMADKHLENLKEKEKETSVWVFRYDKNRELRSHEESVKFGDAAQEQILATGDLKLHVCGFKQPSALFNIMYDVIRGFGIDDLHTLYLGVIKHKIKLWFDSKYSGEPFSIRKYLGVVDDRLAVIHPPNFLERGIRRIEEEFSYWNGNECKTWAHYTSIPVLNGILPDRYLEHYIDLISCLQILQSSSISPQQLLFCQDKLEEYVKNFEILYGSRHMAMVFHLLLHLAFVVTNLGPMRSYSCFPYESLNGEILKMIHGTRYVETQLASGCFLISQLPHKVASLKCASVKDYCFEVMHPSLRLKKLEDLSNNQETIFSVGTYRELKTESYVSSALKKNSELKSISSIETYLRLKKGRTLFVSRSYTRCMKTKSFNCSYFSTHGIQYGAIDIFVKVVTDSGAGELNSKHFAIIEKSETAPFNIGSKTVPNIREYNLNGLFIAVAVSDLKDLLFIVDVENESYICEPCV
ncbi:Protein split ends [Frankliniella fusca]|uniref:Protein split ends n=1 Tax=Frankliniella fusca TaxID=407009 RepID=A0AAE1HLE1_9NEOP|nr:Protein split ends [Frankliniella fusca]